MKTLIALAVMMAACGGAPEAHVAPSPIPRPPPAAVAIAAGDDHTCARMEGGRIYCWGSNAVGQTGGATSGEDYVAPSPLADVGVATALRASGLQTCARTADDRERCFGIAPPENAPARADGQGWRHRCELDDYRVTCRGDGSFGQRGDGTTDSSEEPVAVPGVDQAIEIAAGRVHTCALLVGGEVLCWGDNTFGQVGDGTRQRRLLPTRVALP